MSERRELIDRARFKQVHETTRERVAGALMPSQLVVRARVVLAVPVRPLEWERRVVRHQVGVGREGRRGGRLGGLAPDERRDG